MKATLLIVLLATNLFFWGLPVHARDLEYNQDYYSPKTPDLLKSVEIHHLEPGLEKMRAGNYGKGTSGAFGDFKYILDYFPNHPRALPLIGEVSILMGRPQEAISYYEKALSLYPNYASTHLAYGVFLHKQGKIDEAIKQYKAALAFDQNSRDAHYNLGLAYFSKKDYAAANQHAQAAYGLGYPLPGLRNKLKGVGAWKPLAPQPTAGVPNSEPSGTEAATRAASEK